MRGSASPAPQPARESLVRLASVSRHYRREGVSVPALHAVDLVVRRGEFVAVMGPSGSGKSTLLHVLGLLDADYEGRYELAGQLVSGRSADELARLRNREVGFVFQTFQLLPRLTILENAELPALYARDRSAEACRAAARARLAQLGLAPRLAHRPGELSIGQRQRAAIARALVNDPSLLLADEPTGALDSRTAREILAVFGELHRGGATIVMVTHDAEVASAAERIVHVRDGRVSDGVPQGGFPATRISQVRSAIDPTTAE
jgi:putative ABC transport system ATP-binding protein